MKILIGVAHPKHVHIFKNFTKIMIEKGHDVRIVAVDKEVTEHLLRQYNLPYILIGKNQPTLPRKCISMIKRELLTLKIAKKFNPDIFVGRALPELAHVSAIMKKPFIVFEDTEIARTVHKITVPFSDYIVTPLCYQGDFGRKHIRFNGYFELAYLHPNYFKPDPSVLDYLESGRDKIIIVRFVSWKASHDVNDYGFTNKENIIKCLEQYGQVLITSEAELSEDLEKYKITIPPEKLHHLLYFADLYIGESATIAAECAVLGTPSIFVSTSRRGYTDELESKYGLIYNFSNPKTMRKSALEKAVELLLSRSAKREWEKKRAKMLSEKIDVTKFITELIENYKIPK